jgi:hypothetical protein
MEPVRLSLILALAYGIAAPAQTSENFDSAFSADRPGFATSPSVLGRGLTQVEGGVTFSVDTDGNLRYRTLTFGRPLIRIGLGDSLDLRLAGDGIRLVRSIDSGGRDSTAGWSDLGVGAKFAVVNQGRILPAISLLPSISIPTGHRAFTSSTYDPSLAAAWLKTLPGGLFLGLSGAGAISGLCRNLRCQLRGPKRGTYVGYRCRNEPSVRSPIYRSISRQGTGYTPDCLANLSRRDLRCDTHHYSEAHGNGADPSGSRLGGTL